LTICSSIQYNDYYNTNLSMNIFYGFLQQHQIQKAQTDVENARQKAERIQNDVRDLSARLDALILATQAVWEIVKEQTGVDDEKLLKKMEDIDLRDGVADGKITATIAMCPKCGRSNNSKRGNCIYCGEELANDILGGI